MTGNDVGNRVRYLLNDENRNKWLQRHIAAWINDGTRFIVDNAPYSVYDTDGTVLTITEVTETGLSATLSLPDRWRETLAHYVCARCFGMDSGDRRDKVRSEQHMQTCRGMLGMARGG
jgi:hypothetical protein